MQFITAIGEYVELSGSPYGKLFNPASSSVQFAVLEFQSLDSRATVAS